MATSSDLGFLFPLSCLVKRAEVASFGGIVLVLGVTFGALAVDSGMSGLVAVLMSAGVASGASQLVALSAHSNGGSDAAILIAAWVVAIRLFVLGIPISPRVQFTDRERLFAAHLLIDAAAASALRQDSKSDSRLAYLTMGLTWYISWVLGTVVGAFFGRKISDVDSLGLDVGLPAVLLALIASDVKREPHRRAAIVAVIVSVGASIWLEAGSAVLLGSLVAWFTHVYRTGFRCHSH